jgi:hypothetical protein
VGKNFWRPHLNQGILNRRIVVQAHLGIKQDTISKIINIKGLLVWLKWQMPAEQV